MDSAIDNPISTTAFWTVGVRMIDAKSADPICGDNLAHVFDGEEVSKALGHFESLSTSARNIVTRHYIIDELMKEIISNNEDVQIILLGAGFDTRPFRVRGGEWFEIDEHKIIALKEKYLPSASCGNKLTRISCSFADTTTESVLRSIEPREDALIIIEGVLMYLDSIQVGQLFHDIGSTIPSARIICDVVTESFYRKDLQPVQSAATALSSPFLFTPASPEKYFIDQGYNLITSYSIAGMLAKLELTSEEIKSNQPTTYDVFCLEKNFSQVLMEKTHGL